MACAACRFAGIQGERENEKTMTWSKFIGSINCFLMWMCFFYKSRSGRVIATCHIITRPRTRTGSHPCWPDHLDVLQTVHPRAVTDRGIVCGYGCVTMPGMDVVTDKCSEM